MGKTVGTVLVMAGVLIALWVVAHIPAYLDHQKYCGDIRTVEYYVHVCEGNPDHPAPGCGSYLSEFLKMSTDHNREVTKCRSESWRVFFPK